MVSDDDADFCIGRGQRFLDVVKFLLLLVLSPLCIRDGGGWGSEAMVEVVVGGYQVCIEGGSSGG